MTIGTQVQTYPAPTRHQLVNEGSYLLATQVGIASGAVGTGVTWVAAQTSFVDTGPNFYILNQESVAGGKVLYLDFIKLISTAVGTAAVSWQYAVILDTSARTVTTNHVSACVPVNPRSDAANASSPLINVQTSATASVYSASSSGSKVVGRGVLGGLNIAGRCYGITFGDMASASSFSGVNDTAGNPGSVWSSSCPVAIAPGHCCSIYFWAPSSSAALAPEFELGMWARAT